MTATTNDAIGGTATITGKGVAGNNVALCPKPKRQEEQNANNVMPKTGFRGSICGAVRSQGGSNSPISQHLIGSKTYLTRGQVRRDFHNRTIRSPYARMGNP